MILYKINIKYQFVPYRTDLNPEKDTIALDVGVRTIPGFIDHHHPEAKVECAASLILTRWLRLSWSLSFWNYEPLTQPWIAVPATQKWLIRLLCAQ
jgi:hypothetical protein